MLKLQDNDDSEHDEERKRSERKRVEGGVVNTVLGMVVELQERKSGEILGRKTVADRRRVLPEQDRRYLWEELRVK